MFPVTLRGKQVPMGSGMFVVELINANKGISRMHSYGLVQ